MIRKSFWTGCVQIGIFSLCLCASVAFCLPARAELVDRILAVVNDEIITQREMEERAYLTIMTMPEPPNEADVEKLRQRVLQDLVKDRLVRQAALEKRIILSRDEVESVVEERLGQLREMHGDQLADMLLQEGFSVEEYTEVMRRETKKELIQGRLISEAVQQRIVVTDADVRVEYGARMILTPDGALARRILLDLKSGRLLFPEAVQKHSTGPNVGSGGDMGMFTLGQWSLEIEAEISRMKAPGELSGVVATSAGYAIIELTARRELPSDRLSDAEKQKIRERIRQIKAGSEAEKYVAGLWDQAHIRFLDQQ